MLRSRVFRRLIVGSRPRASSVVDWLPLPRRAFPLPGALPPCRAASVATEERGQITTQAPAPLPEGDDTTTIVLDVRGMMCGGCSASVKRILTAEPEVHTAAVNLMTETAAVQYDSAAGSEAEQGRKFSELVSSKGFPANVRSIDSNLIDKTAELQLRREQELAANSVSLGIAWALAAFCCTHHVSHMLHAAGLHQFAHIPAMHLTENPLVGGAVAAVALLGPGRGILTDGTKALLNGAPNMNSLVGLGACTSFAVGLMSTFLPGLDTELTFLEEPVMLMAFVLLGKSLEQRAKLRATSDLAALAKLIPPQSRMLMNDVDSTHGYDASHCLEAVMVPTVTLREGDVVRVLPGEHVPVDGSVLDGAAAVDESLLTGEAALVPKSSGSEVTGGTVAYEGPLVVRAACTGGASVLGGIGAMVAEAQAREAPIQRLADAVAGKFCYGVMTASAATFAFWFTLGTTMFPQALDFVADVDDEVAPLLLSIKLAVDVLVVACPCALGLATPTAVLVATSLGATRGLLTRGGDVLERLAGVDTVVLDKTGTLTQGRMQLTGLESVSDAFGEGEVLQLAAAVEVTTRHPIADAVSAALEARGLPALGPATGALTQAGAGAVAEVDGRLVAVGTSEWVEQQTGAGQAPAPDATLGLHGAAGESVVCLGVAGHGVVGRLSFADVLRPDAVETVKELRERGMRVMLLSGDAQHVAEHVGAQAGLEPGAVNGGVSPQGKSDFVQRLRAEGACVAMVGDGVNDAPALAAADVGIAMSGGMDAAGDAASVVLMGDTLSQVKDGLELGRVTLGKIKQNLVWALGYNLFSIPLAAGAFLPSMGLALEPSTAGGLMALSSVAVVSNSLLLRWQFRKPASD